MGNHDSEQAVDLVRLLQNDQNPASNLVDMLPLVPVEVLGFATEEASWDLLALCPEACHALFLVERSPHCQCSLETSPRPLTQPSDVIYLSVMGNWETDYLARMNGGIREIVRRGQFPVALVLHVLG